MAIKILLDKLEQVEIMSLVKCETERQSLLNDFRECYVDGENKKRHSYTEIKRWIIQKSRSDGFENGVNTILMNLYYCETVSLFSDFHVEMKKLCDHINLEVLSRTQLAEISKEFENYSVDIFQETKDEIEKMRKNSSKELMETQSKLQTSFISVLGIFSSITFGMFGGLQLLATIFSHAASLSEQQSFFLLVFSVTLFFTMLLTLMSFLLVGIGNIVKGNATLPKIITSNGRYSLYRIIAIISVGIIIISSYVYLNYDVVFVVFEQINTWVWGYMWVIILAIILFFYGLAVFLFFKNKSNKPKKRKKQQS